MAFSPETAVPLNALAEVLLRVGPNSLSEGDREMIAAYVSASVFLCQSVHGAAAAHYWGDKEQLVTD